MSHNLDTTNGQTSFVSAREDAWHALGQVLPNTFTAEEAMEHGLLGGWDVRKVPVMAMLPDGTSLPMPDRFATVRDNPVNAGQVDVLGNVGKGYQVIQNEEHAALLNTLVDESGAHFETAGAIDGGRQVFVTMKMPASMKIGGVDKVDNYIAAINSHDGSKAFTLMVTPVRIVCQNTLNLAFGQATNQFRVRHTIGAERIMVQQAREALDLTFNYLEGFQEEAERMINTTLTQAKFEEIVAKAFGAPKDAPVSTITRTENKIDDMVRLFADSATHEGVRNTVWAGLNALTEYADHLSPTRGTATERDTARHIKAIMDPTFKNKALTAMRSLVSA